MINSSTLTNPIVEQDLTSWFEKHISQTGQESRFCSANTAAKCTLAVIALLRNICFTSLNFEMPYPQYTGALWAAGNILSLSGLDYWAGSRFIDYILPLEKGVEGVFPKETSALQTAAHIANFAPAFLSQIPAVYVAEQYNASSLRIPIGVLVFLGGSVIPLRSIQLFIKKYFHNAAAKKEGINPERQKAFLRLLQENKQRFINMTPEEKSTFIRELETIRKIVNPKERIEKYLGHILSQQTISKKPPLEGTSYALTQFSKGAGLFLSGVYQYTTGDYTFAKTKEALLENDAFAGIMATLVVCSSLYLTGSTIIDSSAKLFHAITGINKEWYEFQETLMEKLSKKSIFRLNILGHMSNILALGVSYVIWKDFYKNKTERLFFESTMCIAVFLLLYASTPAVINDLVEGFLSRNGTLEEKKAIRINKEYQSLIDSIDNISPKHFEEVLKFLPNIQQSPSTNENPPPQMSAEISLHQIPSDMIQNPLYDEESQNDFHGV